MCAKEFGWTKEIIENLPVEYLRGLLFVHKKAREKPVNIPPPPKPKFK